MPSAPRVSTTRSSASGRKATVWHRERTVSGSSWGRADMSRNTVSGGGSSMALSSTSAASSVIRSACSTRSTLGPGSRAVREARAAIHRAVP